MKRLTEKNGTLTLLGPISRRTVAVAFIGKGLMNGRTDAHTND